MAASNNNILMLAPDSAKGSDAQPSSLTLKHNCFISASNAQAGPNSSNSKCLGNAPVHQPKMPKKSSGWHLRQGEVPKEDEKTKVCHMHV